jgi:hypothetical protein
MASSPCRGLRRDVPSSTARYVVFCNTVPSVTCALLTALRFQYEPLDNTTKMFMTERGDPRAIWDVVYGCNPDTDAVQVELAFKARADELGGLMGVRPFNGNYDFRWKGPGTSGK